MKIEYYDKWLSGQSRPMNAISMEGARHRHESRQPYVALIGESDQPRYIIDIAGDWVSVIFMDQMRRQYLRYDFRELQPSRLFLKSAYYWDYEGNSDSVISTKSFSFDESGKILIEDRNMTIGEVQEFESEANTGVNWDQYPQFGEYTSLCNENRAA